MDSTSKHIDLTPGSLRSISEHRLMKTPKVFLHPRITISDSLGVTKWSRKALTRDYWSSIPTCESRGAIFLVLATYVDGNGPRSMVLTQGGSGWAMAFTFDDEQMTL